MSSNQSPRFTPEEYAALFGTSTTSPQVNAAATQSSSHKSGTRGAWNPDHKLARFVPVVVLLAIMWVLEIVDTIVPIDLDAFSLQSWNPVSLYGLITSPLLHSGFPHLVANSFPFLILGCFIAVEGSRRFWTVTVITGLASGLGAWLTTFPSQNIIGASGIIFGFFGYLALRTWFADSVVRKIIYFAIGLFVMITYGASMVFGLLPQDNGISWQGHLFGFAGGIFAAWLIHRRRPQLLTKKD